MFIQQHYLDLASKLSNPEALGNWLEVETYNFSVLDSTIDLVTILYSAAILAD